MHQNYIQQGLDYLREMSKHNKYAWELYTNGQKEYDYLLQQVQRTKIQAPDYQKDENGDYIIGKNGKKKKMTKLQKTLDYFRRFGMGDTYDIMVYAIVTSASKYINDLVHAHLLKAGEKWVDKNGVKSKYKMYYLKHSKDKIDFIKCRLREE